MMSGLAGIERDRVLVGVHVLKLKNRPPGRGVASPVRSVKLCPASVDITHGPAVRDVGPAVERQLAVLHRAAEDDLVRLAGRG